MERELDKQAEPSEKQLKDLQGQAGQGFQGEARPRSRSRSTSCIAPVLGKEGEAEDGYITEQNKFIELAEKEARARGVAEDDFEDFMTDFMDSMSVERPAIEWNSGMTHREIFEGVLEQYFKSHPDQTPQRKEAIKAADPGRKVEARSGRRSRDLSEKRHSRAYRGRRKKPGITRRVM